jgi:thiamine kinase-like enzyme
MSTALVHATNQPQAVSANEILRTVSKEYCMPVISALASVAAEKDLDKMAFIPLLGGGTKAKIFRVELNQQKFVLRLLDENQPLERRKSELCAHKMGEKLQIAPKLIYSDPSYRVMLMDFIEGRELVKEDLDNPDLLKELMQTLKKFHHQPKDESLVKKTKLEAIQDLYERYKDKKGVVFPSCFDRLHRQLQANFASLTAERVPSHGDFNQRNILVAKDGKIYIIDWAQASIDHPFLDIAWLSTFSAANAGQMRALLKAYLERNPSEQEMQEMLFFRSVTTFLVATLWIGRQEEREQGQLDAVGLIELPAYSRVCQALL